MRYKVLRSCVSGKYRITKGETVELPDDVAAGFGTRLVPLDEAQAEPKKGKKAKKAQAEPKADEKTLEEFTREELEAKCVELGYTKEAVEAAADEAALIGLIREMEEDEAKE